MTDRQKRLLRVAALVVVAGALVVAGKTSGLASHGSIERVRALIVESGGWGVALFVLVFAIGEMLHVPGLFFVAAGVLAYGRLWGGLLGWSASIVAISVTFLMARAVAGGPAFADVKNAFMKRVLARPRAPPDPHRVPPPHGVLAVAAAHLRARALARHLPGLPGRLGRRPRGARRRGRLLLRRAREVPGISARRALSAPATTVSAQAMVGGAGRGICVPQLRRDRGAPFSKALDEPRPANTRRPRARLARLRGRRLVPDRHLDLRGHRHDGAGAQATPSLLLFGGHFERTTNRDPASDYLGDAWSWTGSTWTSVSVTAGPGSRDLAAMAPFGHAALLFGGEGGDPDHDRTTLSDTWLWSGSAWKTVTPSGTAPEPMAGPTGVTCNGRFVLFGGYDFTGTNRYDTWSWDGASWTEFPSTGVDFQPPSTGPQSSLGNVAATMKGGACFLMDPLGSLFTWTGVTWSTVDQGHLSPPARSFASMAARGDTLVLFGGASSSGKALGDTWVWDGTSWTESHGSGPSARSSSVMGEYGGADVLFGGVRPPRRGTDRAGEFLGDTWTWDGASWTEVTAATGPGPRADAAMSTQ